ncbi:hypothetical protein EVA_20229 [gut metagenome]|uniref:Uncharacterized protein n=1 Tax=gut metagenome TaxID=749906 RepID=J9FB50_9ZZZZ
MLDRYTSCPIYASPANTHNSLKCCKQTGCYHNSSQQCSPRSSMNTSRTADQSSQNTQDCDAGKTHLLQDQAIHHCHSQKQDSKQIEYQRTSQPLQAYQPGQHSLFLFHKNTSLVLCHKHIPREC